MFAFLDKAIYDKSLLVVFSTSNLQINWKPKNLNQKTWKSATRDRRRKMEQNKQAFLSALSKLAQ